MAALSIYSHQYIYGAGNGPNRAIDFYGDDNKVWGIVRRRINGSWEEIGKIDESQMILEKASTTEKLQIMANARQANIPTEYPKDQQFDQIDYRERVNVIQSLQPMGKLRMTITNNIFDNPYFEKIERLFFFDPS